MMSRDERALDPAAIKGSPAQALFAATLGFFTGFAAVALFGPTASRFQQLMRLSPMAVGLLVAMPALSGSLLRIPFAAWVDKGGGRKPYLVLLSLSILGMTGLYLVVQLLYPARIGPELYPVLLLLAVLAGCGIATFSVGISQVSYWFPQKKQGTALGTYGGVGNLAPGLFSFLIPVALREWGLAGSYLAWLVFLVAGASSYALFGRNAPYFQLLKQGTDRVAAREKAAATGQELFPAWNIRESLRISAGAWKTWALVLVYFTSFGGFIGLTAWLPTYWQKFMGTGLLLAGGLTALYSILASLVRVVGGYISDRIGGYVTATLGLATTLLGAALLVLSGPFGFCLAAVVVLALGMGMTNAAVFKLVPQAVPRAVGGAAGWVGGLGAFGGFVIPPLMALFVETWGRRGYSLGFGLFLILGLAALGAVLLLKRLSEAPAATRATPQTVRESTTL